MSGYSRNVRGGETVHTPFRLLNAFCVFSDYVPLTLDEWIEKDREIAQLIEDREKQLGRILTDEDWYQMNTEMVRRFTGRSPVSD